MSEPTTWRQMYEESAYCIATLARMAKLDESSFRKYLNGSRIPRQANTNKMDHVMKHAGEFQRLKFHQSYGYATNEQIEQLKTMKAGPDMQMLLKQIEEQTRNRGKYL